jgi:hypothetical protein
MAVQQPVMATSMAQPAGTNVVVVSAGGHGGSAADLQAENCAKTMFILTCFSGFFWPFLFVGW